MWVTGLYYFSHRLNYLLGNKIFPGVIKHTSYLTPDREPTVDQSVVTTAEVQLGEPMNFLVSGYFQE